MRTAQLFCRKLLQGSHWPGKSRKVTNFALAVREKVNISSMFFSSCIMTVTFFNRSLIVACLGKSALLYVMMMMMMMMIIIIIISLYIIMMMMMMMIKFVNYTAVMTQL